MKAPQNPPQNGVDKMGLHNNIVVSVIPQLMDIGGPYKVLPPGVHDASIEEIEQEYAYNAHRKHLFDGFIKLFRELEKAGCQAIFLDGSFVTDKALPSDFDVCWLPAGVNFKKLDPILLFSPGGRAKQKQKYGGECFPSTARAAMGFSFFEYFQRDKDTKKPKGIIRVH